jgi:hypothetical protein
MLRKTIFSICLLFQCASHLLAQQLYSTELHNADLLFQDLDCGPLCDAIEQVTQSYGGHHFSHIGLVDIEGDSVFIIEAIGSAVQKTPLQHFLSRSHHQVLVGRLKPEFASMRSDVLAFATKQIGVPYDEAFLYANGKYYCSELIYDAFKDANHQKAFFELQPMTFKQPHRKTFFPVWVTYYQQLQMPIPEGALGINPGGISRSNRLDKYLFQKDFKIN